MDTGVLMSASGLGALTYHDESMRLLEHMREHDEAVLVLDSEGLILYQYESKMDPSQLGRQWLRQMFEAGKVAEVKRKALDRGTSTALRDCHLDPEDMKYFVRTCAASTSKRLVTHDDDYSPEVRSILKKRLGVTVCAQRDGSRFIRD